MISFERPSNLQQLLHDAASVRQPEKVIIYPTGNTSEPLEVDYRNLYYQAIHASRVLSQLPGFKVGEPILLHLDYHWDTILWFWATILADALPVLSSPFSNVEEHRHKHIQNLSSLLESPLCITRAKFLKSFECDHDISIHTVESLLTTGIALGHMLDLPRRTKNVDIAILMLTSGSTGNAKAVQLSHNQILAAVIGKSSVRQLPSGKPFLNWVGLDHVASLVEIHLQAMYLGVSQVHVHPADVVSSPLSFLDLLSRHQIARSFAPNFFLAKLAAAADASREQAWDLSSLTVLASGGEANDVRTCVAASSMFAKYGAPPNVITTGFGMTETCAGAIFNLDCPNYDVQRNRAFASLGECMKGIQMRVRIYSEDAADRPAGERPAVVDEIGELELQGDVVFQGYYRNEIATAAAFRPGGWFRTGDLASIDAAGQLNLVGRLHDTINVNGIKINTSDLHTSLEKAVAGEANTIVVFPSRSETSTTEQITVAYIPRKWPLSPEEAAQQRHILVAATITHAGTQPIVFALEDESWLPKSTLGKVSRAKMRKLFENNHFAEFVDQYQKLLSTHAAATVIAPATESERLLLEDLMSALDTDVGVVGVETSIFELNIDSMSLIRLKRRMEGRLGMEIPVITLMNNPTVRGLANALEELGSEKAYNPIVTLRAQGEKTPLWLIHPGVGEVLVFFGLGSLVENRPVYALRARGFDGEQHFADLDDMVSTYYAAIKQKQPSGPYALAGYSYGSMVAFEVAKRLENDGSKIQFLGSFNLPPHIKSRMRQLNWNMCLLHLSYFLGLTTEQFADAMDDSFRELPREQAMTIVLDAADQARMVELGLSTSGLANWAELAFGLQSLAVDYEPSGTVGLMDVFHAIPLKVAAKSREDWLENHLSKWDSFTRSEPRFHEVDGAHYTMIGPEHVAGFAHKLNTVLDERGL